MVQDMMRGWGRRGSDGPDLASVVREIAARCRPYHLSTVVGDRYAAGWVRERFRAEGLRYQEAEIRVPDDPTATRYLEKSVAYLEVEPLFAQGRVALLDPPPGFTPVESNRKWSSAAFSANWLLIRTPP